MHAETDLFPDDIAPLPPPPAGPRRLARGSWPPIDLTVELDAMSAREIAAPEGWSRVVPVRLPAKPVAFLDRTATAVVAALSVAMGGLATLLLL